MSISNIVEHEPTNDNLEDLDQLIRIELNNIINNLGKLENELKPVLNRDPVIHDREQQDCVDPSDDDKVVSPLVQSGRLRLNRLRYLNSCVNDIRKANTISYPSIETKD